MVDLNGCVVCRETLPTCSRCHACIYCGNFDDMDRCSVHEKNSYCDDCVLKSNREWRREDG